MIVIGAFKGVGFCRAVAILNCRGSRELPVGYQEALG